MAKTPRQCFGKYFEREIIMTIKEAEEYTGLTRSNIRFYEKEGLITPVRTEGNGYRNYSEEDIENIKKIACLRTLGISVENIHSVKEGELSLYDVLAEQSVRLRGQIDDLNKAKAVCERMLETENISFEKLRVERYVDDLQEYWKDNEPVFCLDCAGFLHIWSSQVIWAVITILSLITAILSYGKLPPEIPIQWSGAEAISLVGKNFIFAYPVSCVAVRFLMRPFIYVKISGRSPYGGLVTEYITNFLCFVILSVEVFTLLFVYGLAENIVTVLLAETVVFIGLLVVVITRTGRRGRGKRKGRISRF